MHFSLIASIIVSFIFLFVRTKELHLFLFLLFLLCSNIFLFHKSIELSIIIFFNFLNSSTYYIYNMVSMEIDGLDDKKVIPDDTRTLRYMLVILSFLFLGAFTVLLTNLIEEFKFKNLKFAENLEVVPLFLGIVFICLGIIHILLKDREILND